MEWFAQVVDSIAEFGAGWALVFAMIGLLALFGNKLIKIYSTVTAARVEIEQQREKRKQEEADERIEHDREMAEIKGQMVAQMGRSNTLMEALKALMENVVTSNAMLHEDLKTSQAGSRQLQSDVRDMKQQVAVIYDRSK